FSSRRRHTRFSRDWSSDVCSSDLKYPALRASNGLWKHAPITNHIRDFCTFFLSLQGLKPRDLMNWKQLLSAKRWGYEDRLLNEQFDARSEFQRDYDRLIFSSPFRRFQ